ncbi:MAG: GDP-mannose 4,6-dehydratase [Candidatus Rokubacteria bacterium]|nr:GDP-mannose 4,6-dehydratase [Candidatus Rokubacteria bacterium]
MTRAWRDLPVVVTGATGLLGGWLVEALLARGAHVIAIVRDRVPRSRLLRERVIDRIDVAWGDVRDAELVERVLAEYEAECVFHLAAQTIVGIANRAPVSTFDTNVRGTWTVLEAARRVPTVTRVIVASSDKAYGEHDVLPYDESAPLQGRHPYDASKSAADLIAQSYFHTFELPVVVTRCGNLFGGGDLNWNRIVPGTIRSALYGERPVIRSDGGLVRDYLYVEDAVDAYLAVADALSAGEDIAGTALNVSYEQPLAVVDIVDRILGVMARRDLTPDIRNEASNEIREQYLRAARMRKLGWSPRHTLDEGLAKTVAWYRRFLGTPVAP